MTRKHYVKLVALFSVVGLTLCAPRSATAQPAASLYTWYCTATEEGGGHKVYLSRLFNWEPRPDWIATGYGPRYLELQFKQFLNEQGLNVNCSGKGDIQQARRVLESLVLDFRGIDSRLQVIQTDWPPPN